MSSTQILQNEISQTLQANTWYNEMKGQWKFFLESYLGGEDYRIAGHLVKYQLETENEYKARLRSTPLENHCASVISVYNSFLFRTVPDREYGSISPLPELEDFLRDADMDGRSLDAFMKDVATWSSVFGHCWIILAKPDVGAVTRADEQAMGIRPYVSLLTPLVVLDWAWKRMPSGRFELSYFKYLEEVNGDQRTIKEWYPDIIKTTVVDLKDNTMSEELIEVNGLGKIPAICAYNGRSTIRGIGISDICDIADAQKFIYNATSEVEQTIRMDSHPSLVKTPETQAGTGSGSIIHMPENLDPGLKPYLLEHSGASVTSIYEAINHAIASIDKMANTGAVRATESRTMSGVAMETEFQLLNARLSEKADNIELAEEQMWKLWAEYMGYTWDGEIDYPGSFNMRDTVREIDQLVKAKSAATDPRVLQVIDHEIVEILGEDADIVMPEIVTLPDGTEAPLDAVEPFEEPEELFNPVTGESGWVIDFNSRKEALMNGWVEKE
ncbi:hypothetical protein UFOVP647_25 [uncultured Caudovirales phage]|uniref:Portal protein n=1 Tax=uncultured Caudovirales phage TaxID=2100421 RepID=A0A6J5N5F1_9CAUD|nr:hypothetical protein UFOVP647_25 [uncultured Caudovirales phage]